MSYFYYHIPNSGFIRVYSYNCYYAKAQETQNYRSYMWSILFLWIIEPNDYLLLKNFLCYLIHTNFIYIDDDMIFQLPSSLNIHKFY